MAADRGLMPNDPIRLRRPLERVALVTRLPAAWPARPAAKAAQARLLLQSVARGRPGPRRAVQIQPAPKLRRLRAKTLDLTRLRHDQGFDLGRKTQSTLESHLTASVSVSTQKSPTPKPTVTKMTHHGLGVTSTFRSAVSSQRPHSETPRSGLEERFFYRASGRRPAASFETRRFWRRCSGRCRLLPKPSAPRVSIGSPRSYMERCA